MNDVLFYSIAIIALLVGNVMLIAFGFMAARLYFNTSNAEPEQDAFTNMRQDVKSITLSLASLSERLAKLELHIGQLRESSDKQGSSLSRDSDQKSFKIATKLALQGANVDEIVELCGLARGEAELIRMLHANNQVSSSGLSDHEAPPPKRPARIIDFSGVNSALRPD